jgi:hypothetical protein
VLIDELQARGSLARVARHRLAVYAQLFAQYHRLTVFVNLNGQVLETRNDKGEVKNQTVAPEASHQVRLVEALRKFDKEFGFLETVQAQAGQAGANQEDPLEALRHKLLARLAGTAQTHN